MTFAKNYFGRFKSGPKIFNIDPCPKTGIIVVIPCYNDIFIFETLKSLDSATPAEVKVEVIVIVNSGENTGDEIVTINRQIHQQLVLNKTADVYKTFDLLVHLAENVPTKVAGVGHARKTGMDEAVRRFNTIENADGIIVSLDADCLVSTNYFVSIEKYFRNNQKSGACTIQFRHDFDENKYDKDVISACQLYEIYLRYFRLSLSFSGFPYPLHTIGSCFCVKAESYIKAGGMSQRQGGEDFYFLHKLAPMTNVGTINETLVFPSPRISDRVPFGTGPAVNKIISEGNYKVYNFALFKILKQFYSGFDSLYIANSENILAQIIPEEIFVYADTENLQAIIIECRQNTNKPTAFRKRMFSKFDAFFAIRFLNSFDEQSKYPPEDVLMSANKFLLSQSTILSEINIKTIYTAILDSDHFE
jgi:hypothetical protein